MSTSGRIIARDVCSALVVLALLFLNFGHSGTGIAAERGFAPVLADLCGDAPVGEPGHDPNPCQACRLVAGLDLPPAPGALDVVWFAGVAVDYEVASLRVGAFGVPGGFSARAPPAA